MTFCSSDCVNRNCRRNYTDDIHLAARAWWSHDPDNAPVAFSDLSKDCPGYMKGS
jgi:hypothetical protein